MLVFVDESGDPGRKIANRSSRFFVVAMVSFADHEVARLCDERITRLKKELGYEESFEFHFSKNSPRVRKAFLNATSPYAFRYHVFALNKASDRLYGEGFMHSGSTYKWVTGTVFDNAKSYIRDASVVLDKSGERKFIKELRTYLRRRINSPSDRFIRKVTARHSHQDNLLQLADYVAGVSNRAICERSDGISLRQRYLRNKELNLRVWPP